MEKRPLGRTGLHVSKICLGSMTWGQQNTEAEGHAQMDLAVDRGVNFIDTAAGYGDGKSERLIAQVLKERSERV